MPDPYQNPDRKPYLGDLQWVPKGPPTGGAVPVGFRQPSLERGRFRNDLPLQKGYDGGTLKITYEGILVSSEGSELWPVLNAFRPLARPSSVRGAPPGGPFEVKGSNLRWTAELVTTLEISSITIDYSLTVNLMDDGVFDIIPKNSEDGQAILAWRSDPNQPLAVEWNKYKAAKVMVDDKEWPAFVDDKPVELGLTGYQSTRTGFVETRRSVTIKFGAALNPGTYPRPKTVSIVNRSGANNLKLALHKFMMFNAVRCNIDHEQLPCNVLSYAFPVFFNWTPSILTPPIYPPTIRRPNVHVKVFSPDYRTGSPGFAHSFYLRFLLFAAPITFLSVLGADLWLAVFIGPMPSTRNVRYTFLGQRAFTNTTGRVAPLDYFPLQPTVQTIKLQKSESASVPTDDLEWEDLPNGVYIVESPPAFNPLGPWLRHYTYYDTAGTDKTWYRSLQTLSTGGEVVTQAFRGSLFSERQAMKLIDTPVNLSSYGTTTLVRRVQFPPTLQQALNSEQVAVFVASDEDRTYYNSLDFVKGAFNLAFVAQCVDPETLVNAHLYARIWFIPANEPMTQLNINQYRAATEIVFETEEDGLTNLVRRSPRDLSELLVSPPLPNGYTQINLVRYINNDVSFDLPPTTDGWRMVVGIYNYATRTDAGASLTDSSYNVPRFALSVDSADMYIETTLRQTLSYTLYTQRATNFNSSRYVAYDAPLLAASRLVGGTSLSYEGDKFTSYSRVFRSPRNEDETVENAFYGLATLRDPADQTPARVVIPYADVSNTFNQGQFVAADFVTDGKMLMGGLVKDGRWSIKLVTKYENDRAEIAANLRFEALLVTPNGVVIERVFRSPIIQDTDVNQTEFTYEANIQVPFLISNDDIQLVLRVYAYPYSRSGGTVNIPGLEDAGIQVGLRIESLEILSHTLNRVEVDQTDSLLGSPAFYEDLPLQPTRSIGDETFWFVAASDLNALAIIDPIKGWDITGCVYSPTWLVDLPADMEVRSGALGFRDSIIWFRTVPSTETTKAQEFGIALEESELNHTVHVAYGETSTLTATNEQVIRHIQMDAPYIASRDNTYVSGLKSSTSQTFEGKNPSLLFIAPNGGMQPSTSLSIVAQASATEGASYNVAINPSNGEPDRWIGPNRDMGDNNWGSIRRLAQGMVNPAIARPYNGPVLYVAGWVEPGTIVVKVANIFDTGTSGELAPGDIYIVDGDPNLALGSNQEGILPQGELSGKAVQTFVGVTANNQGNCIVAYVLEGEAGRIYARTFSGSYFSKRFILVNMRLQGTSGSSNIAIYAPALAWHLKTQTGVVAFWCGGKIFVAEIISLFDTDTTILSQVQLVAGSRDFTAEDNTANAHFAAMKAAGALNDSQMGEIESDVPRQRVGLKVIGNPPYDGKVFVVYRNKQGLMQMREVAVGATTFAPVQVT